MMVRDVPGGGTEQPRCRAGLRATLTSVRNSPRLPLALLLLALSTVFLFGNDRGYFYRFLSDRVSANFLAISANRSPAHNFLGFRRQTLDADGAPSYEVYNRFPIGGYLLIKLAILPFADDSSAQLYAARLLMLLFFTATAVLAYLSLARLTAHRWMALTATLLTFSSTYCLYYNDVVDTEVWPDLFGIFLVFHGMVLFVQEGRFRQLLGKTCLALLLGWHVYALLLPFVVLGLAGALVRAVRSGGGISAWGHLPRVTASLLRSRYLTLGVVALLFGTAVLSFNFANEYVALNGETDLTNLPSFRSMLKRTGQREDYIALYAKWTAWPYFPKTQFYRIAGMSLPFAFTEHDILDPFPGPPLGWQHVIGIVVSGTGLIGLAFVRYQILWATLVLSGFCWALPMRHMTSPPFHNFESLVYIGLPLFFFSLVLLFIHRLSGRRLVLGLSVAALLVFVLSNFQMSRGGYYAVEDAGSRYWKDVMTDFDVIRKMTVGNVVAMPTSLTYMRYALTGTVLLFEPGRLADFVISRSRHESAALLTPDNRRVFLYRHDEYERHIEHMLGTTPLIHAHYRQHIVDVYLYDGHLYYVRRHPRSVVALLDWHVPVVGEPVQATLSIPLRATRPWQWERGNDRDGWTTVRSKLSDGSHQYVPTAADLGSRLRAHVEYLDSEGQWVKASTDSSPAVVAPGTGQRAQRRLPPGHARFFLHVIPVDVSDLPNRRKPWNFDNLDFFFREYPPYRAQAIAVRELPAYDIAGIRTGQFTKEANHYHTLWAGEVSFDETPSRNRHVPTPSRGGQWDGLEKPEHP